jgi:YggT family protein
MALEDTLLSLLSSVLQLYIFVIFAMVIMSWLTAFNVVNPRNPFVAQVDRALYAITNPVLNPIRRILPSMGGLDLSPLVVVLLLGAAMHLIDDVRRGVPLLTF